MMRKIQEKWQACLPVKLPFLGKSIPEVAYHLMIAYLRQHTNTWKDWFYHTKLSLVSLHLLMVFAGWVTPKSHHWCPSSLVNLPLPLLWHLRVEQKTNMAEMSTEGLLRVIHPNTIDPDLTACVDFITVTSNQEMLWSQPLVITKINIALLGKPQTITARIHLRVGWQTLWVSLWQSGVSSCLRETHEEAPW